MEITQKVKEALYRGDEIEVSLTNNRTIIGKFIRSDCDVYKNAPISYIIMDVTNENEPNDLIPKRQLYIMSSIKSITLQKRADSEDSGVIL